MKRNRFIFLGGVAAVIALVAGGIVWWKFAPLPGTVSGEPEKPADHLTLKPVGFDALTDWAHDDMRGALHAFQRSCRAMMKRGDERDIGPDKRMGKVGDWRATCQQALDFNSTSIGPDDARRFFQTGFKPYLVGNNDNPEGLFTGYFEPELRGSLTREGKFQTALYLKPDDMVSIDLGAFRKDLAGTTLVGRLDGSNVKPYYDRASIEGGALAARNLEMVWVDDAVDAFFLHIQGSGRVVLPDNSVLRVGYAATNGHPYFAIGRELIARGALTKETVSLQTIRQWLYDHPDQADTVMNTNASFVFFRPLPVDPDDPDAGPLGSQGVALETGRSLAVDRRFHAMGVPIWLETDDALDADEPIHRLMVAQDTGGAIRGPVRGDIFFGAGKQAELNAGHMNRQGHKYLLLPNAVDPLAAQPQAIPAGGENKS